MNTAVPASPTPDELFEQTRDVIADWAKKPRNAVQAATKLAMLRPGKTRALALKLMAHFEDDYAPEFDEQRFDRMWRTAAIATVENAYWVVVLSFSQPGELA